MRKTIIIFLSLLLALVFSGCINLKPVEDPTRFYTLNSGAVGSHDKDSGELKVILVELTMPPYLESRKIVTLSGNNEVKYSEFNRWSEDLDQLLGHVVSDQLHAHPRISTVDIFPWNRNAEYDTIIKIHISKFARTTPASLRPTCPATQRTSTPRRRPRCWTGHARSSRCATAMPCR